VYLTLPAPIKEIFTGISTPPHLNSEYSF
jgi:hypothetical protein